MSRRSRPLTPLLFCSRHRCQTGGKWLCCYQKFGALMWAYNEEDVKLWLHYPIDLEKRASEECGRRDKSAMAAMWESDKCW